MTKQVNMDAKALLRATSGAVPLKTIATERPNQAVIFDGMALMEDEDGTVTVFLKDENGTVYGTNSGAIIRSAEIMLDIMNGGEAIEMAFCMKKGESGNEYIEVEIL